MVHCGPRLRKPGASGTSSSTRRRGHRALPSPAGVAPARTNRLEDSSPTPCAARCPIPPLNIPRPVGSPDSLNRTEGRNNQPLLWPTMENLDFFQITFSSTRRSFIKPILSSKTHIYGVSSGELQSTKCVPFGKTNYHFYLLAPLTVTPYEVLKIPKLAHTTLTPRTFTYWPSSSSLCFFCCFSKTSHTDAFTVELLRGSQPLFFKTSF